MTPEQLREEAFREFEKWFIANYPGPETIISDPAWHAPKIFRSATHMINKAHAAALEEIERLKVENEELRGACLSAAMQATPLTPHGEAIAAGDGTLHGAIDYWQEQSFKMAAGQCCVKSGGLMADDHGNTYCDMERRVSELRGRMRVMTNIMGDALSVMNTIQEEESDEETRLDALRAKMAGAIDSVLRSEKASIYKERE